MTDYDVLRNSYVKSKTQFQMSSFTFIPTFMDIYIRITIKDYVIILNIIREREIIKLSTMCTHTAQYTRNRHAIFYFKNKHYFNNN